MILDKNICVHCHTNYSSNYLIKIDGKIYCKNCVKKYFTKEQLETHLERKVEREKSYKKVLLYSYILFQLLMTVIVVPVLLKNILIEKKLWFVFITINLPAFILAFKFFLPNKGDLSTSVFYLIKPDFLSLLQGKYWEDRRYETFFFGPFVFVGIIVVIEYVVSTFIYYTFM